MNEFVNMLTLVNEFAAGSMRPAQNLESLRIGEGQHPLGLIQSPGEQQIACRLDREASIRQQVNLAPFKPSLVDDLAHTRRGPLPGARAQDGGTSNGRLISSPRSSCSGAVIA